MKRSRSHLNSFFFPILFAAMLLSGGCEDPIRHIDDVDLPTRGKVKLFVDENVMPLSELLIDAFENTYQDAFLFQTYAQEPAVIQALLDDTARLAIMTRPLSADEKKYFEAKKFGIEQVRIASDAVVLLVNRNNPDSLFTVEQVKQMLLGSDTLWSDINGASKLGSIHLVFDNSRSSNLRYLSDTLLGGQAPGKNCFALASSDSVIAYVERDPGAIGIVGLNWLGDKYSDADVARRSHISIAMVGTSADKAVHPTQSNLVTAAYPFVRGVYIVKIGLRAGLGTGFATFCYQERGQLIIQHAGLAPSNPAERKIQINTH